ncbi:MAG: hypothetical protein J6B01_08660 [Ruminococcus sp.]|nr:hypothetical protein [Ruminococcus sp.]
MKKFLTILLAVSMMSCTFASCGKKDSDKEDKKSSVAEEEVLPAVGRWEPVDTEDMIFDIRSENEAYICVVQDLSDALYFEDDNFMFSGEEFADKDYDFDGETFVLHAFNDNDLTMKKTDGSEELYGEYQWISGDAYDAIATGFNNEAAENNDDETFDEEKMKIFVNFTEDSTILEARMTIDDFKLSDKKITISGAIFGDDELRDAEYSVDGDKMIIINAQGEEVELERITEAE